MKKIFIFILVPFVVLVSSASSTNRNPDRAAMPYFATQCINIPNGQAADIRDVLATYWGYTGNPADNTAKNEFVRSYIARFVKEQYIAAKATAASEAARAQAISDNGAVDIN